MKVQLAGVQYDGRAVDLTDRGLSPSAVAAAVREEGAGGVDLTVRCPDPGPVHDRVGVVTPNATVSVRAALAAAARSRGLSAPQDDEIAATANRIAAVDVPDVSLQEARRRVAEAEGDETELRERVAALRGRVQALRETGTDPADAEAELATATRQLSEAETERIAAEQALERARDRAETAHDRREERLRLRDRKANLERAARDHLARQVHAEFRDAVAAVPGEGSAGTRPGEFEGDDATAALAVARVADVDAPLVLAVDRFASATAAADRLDVPVLHV
ncbi:DUF7856 family protein [Halomicrococcus gelatinilyticus]|uniref:DUF7856 family protein n=1 Tax=Halomicrococcus gelatinilyticus TaxID=1702103 RepID=UPI002E0E3E3A